MEIQDPSKSGGDSMKEQELKQFLHLLLPSEGQILPQQLDGRVYSHLDSLSPWVGIILKWGGGKGPHGSCKWRVI